VRLNIFVFFGLAFVLCGFIPGLAYASKTVTSPNVTKGEAHVEWKSEYTVDDNASRDGAWKQKASIGYGFTSFWSSEIESSIEKSGAANADTDFSKIDWKNKIQFTSADQYGFDTGMRLTYSLNTATSPDEIEVKFLAARDFTHSAHRANLIFSREVGDDAGDETEWGISWSSRYKYSDAFQPGVEVHSVFGEVGNEGDFNTQDHRIGPVA
jgi:hypothetical protein